MEIRLANNTDIPGMIELLKQVGRVHHDIRPDLFRAGAQKYSVSDLEQLLKEVTRPIFVGVEEGKLLGYCFCILQITRNDPVLCDRKVLYIDDLCVDENHRRQGIANRLYQQVLDYARQLHCDAVTLNVWCGNEGAMKFYEKCGLKPQKIGMETILC